MAGACRESFGLGYIPADVMPSEVVGALPAQPEPLRINIDYEAFAQIFAFERKRALALQQDIDCTAAPRRADISSRIF
jgi:hypothetical protein